MTNGINSLKNKQVNIFNGQKWYSYNQKKVVSSYLQLDILPCEKQIEEWIEILKSKLTENSSNMWVFIIFDIKSNTTYEYQVTSKYVKEIVKEGILSIGEDIMPLIARRLKKEKTLDEQINVIVKMLIEQDKTIATMESCTGGGLANQITNVEGASKILKESYITYCNEAKIKFGVQKQIIDKYSVYSAQTAQAMAEAVLSNTKSNIGVGITGQLGRVDPNNPGVKNNQVWYCIIEGHRKIACKIELSLEATREQKKEVVLREISESLYNNLYLK